MCYQDGSHEGLQLCGIGLCAGYLKGYGFSKAVHSMGRNVYLLSYVFSGAQWGIGGVLPWKKGA